MAAQLEEARTNRLEVERAWQHFACAQDVVETMEWQPLDRSSGRVLRVGPEREFKTVAAAARVAKDGDTVEIDPGTYKGDVALWPQNDLLVRGVGERPLITSNGKVIQDRDVWLFTGDDVVVENVEISGARSRYENGAGIRHIGNGLTLRHVYLHDNENGLLTGNRHPETNKYSSSFPSSHETVTVVVTRTISTWVVRSASRCATATRMHRVAATSSSPAPARIRSPTTG